MLLRYGHHEQQQQQHQQERQQQPQQQPQHQHHVQLNLNLHLRLHALQSPPKIHRPSTAWRWNWRCRDEKSPPSPGWAVLPVAGLHPPPDHRVRRSTATAVRRCLTRWTRWFPGVHGLQLRDLPETEHLSNIISKMSTFPVAALAVLYTVCICMSCHVVSN